MNPPAPTTIVLYSEAEETGGVSGVVENIVQTGSTGSHFIVICPNTDGVVRWGNSIRSPSVSVLHAALRNREDVLGWFDVPGMIRLYRTFRHAPLVHFHLHTPFACLPAIVLARFAGVRRLVTTEHYITQLRYIRRRRRSPIVSFVRECKIRTLLQIKCWCFGLLDRVVTVSETNGQYADQLFGKRVQGKILTIYNGIDLERFCVDRSRQVDRQKFDVPDRTSHVVSVVAGLNSQKGHEYLLRGIPTIVREMPNVLFLLVGDGPLRSYLEKLSHDLRIDRNVRFLGKQSDVPAILPMSDLFVLPSLFEGMPLSVIEAMAAGVAVVATRVDGTAEVVDDDVTGFLVPPKDTDALAAKVIEVLQNDRLRESFAVRGKERAKKIFNRDRMVQQYQQLYAELIGHKQPMGAIE